MKRFLFCIALMGGLLLGGRAQAQTALTNIDEALKVAQAKQLPVFVDFSAVWCHSCHEMDAKVLNGADWENRQSRFVLVRSDADGTNGAAWMKKLNVPVLPVYVVLNPDGSERGRLTGEFERAKFYPALDRLLSGQDSFAKLKMDAAHGSSEAAAEVLHAYDQRDDAQAGVDWFAKLPAAARKAAQDDAHAAMRLAIDRAHAEQQKMFFSRPGRPYTKLKLSAAQRVQVAKDCRTHALQALAGPIGIDDRVDVAKTLLFCAGELPPAQRKAIAAAQLPGLQALYAKDVPNASSGTLREATYALAQYYEALDDKANAKATFARAIAIGRKTLDDGHGHLDVKRDRSMADVTAEFLMHEGPEAEYTAFAKAMAEAWPDDYICQFNYGSDLLRHGKAAEALPYLVRASDKASPAWKLNTTYARAKALVALHRRPEAEKLFNAALRQAEKEFPEQTRYEKMDMKL